MKIFDIFCKKQKNDNSALKEFYKNNQLIILCSNGTKKINPESINIDIFSTDSFNNKIIMHEKQNPNSLLKFSFYKSNNNEIFIGQNNEINIDFRIQGNNGKCQIGDNNYICSCIIYFYCSGNTEFRIGNGNLFSEQIIFWAGEGHSIIDSKTYRATNQGSNIKIGDNNWVCMKACFLKHAVIPNGCVVGYGSVITKKFEENNCIIAGNPAVIVKHDILWSEQTPWLYDGCLYRNKNI